MQPPTATWPELMPEQRWALRPWASALLGFADLGPSRHWALAPLGPCALRHLRSFCALGLLRPWAVAPLGLAPFGPCALRLLRPWPPCAQAPSARYSLPFAISLRRERLTTAECGPKLPPSYNAGDVRWAYGPRRISRS